jgi:hypothetical protein
MGNLGLYKADNVWSVRQSMFARIMNFDSDLLSKVSVCLLLCFMTKPISAVEAQKPEISLADRIVLENKIHREEFYGDVRLLHAPNPMDVQFSEMVRSCSPKRKPFVSGGVIQAPI